MTRRSFLPRLGGGLALAGTVSSLATRLTAADNASGLKGRINHSVCKWCFPKVDLEDLCQASKEMGITSIDLVPPEGWPTLKKLGLTCAMAKASEPNPRAAGTGLRIKMNSSRCSRASSRSRRMPDYRTSSVFPAIVVAWTNSRDSRTAPSG